MKKVFGNVLLLFCGYLFSFNSSEAAELPIQMINGLPYIEAKVNGKGPFLFGFDSGFSGEIELDSSLAKELGLVFKDKMQVGDPSGRNGFTAASGRIKNLQLADIGIKNASAFLRNRRAMPGMEKVAGILGIALFKNYVITLNYSVLKFTINKDELPSSNNTTILDYEALGGGIPSIPIKVGNEFINAHIDTRAMGSSFRFPESFLTKNTTYVNDPKVIARGRTASNEFIINEVQIKENIQVGRYIFESPAVTYPSPTGDGVIGARTLKDFVITIDQINKRIQFIEAAKETSKIQANTQRTLKEYTGEFGVRTINIDESGFLFIQRNPNGRPMRMVQKEADIFSLEAVPDAIIKFERNTDNKIVAIQVLNPQKVWERIEKNK